MLSALRRGPRIGLSATAMMTRRNGLHVSKPAAKAAVAEDMNTILFKSDHTTTGMHLYHKVNIALIGLGPLSLLLSPSSLSFPIDLAMGVLIPLHSHLGSNDVISDYAKKVTKAKWFDSVLRKGTFGMTVITFLGLLRLNLQGPGIAEGIKSLWRPKAKE